MRISNTGARVREIPLTGGKPSRFAATAPLTRLRNHAKDDWHLECSTVNGADGTGGCHKQEEVLYASQNRIKTSVTC